MVALHHLYATSDYCSFGGYVYESDFTAYMMRKDFAGMFNVLLRFRGIRACEENALCFG